MTDIVKRLQPPPNSAPATPAAAIPATVSRFEPRAPEGAALSVTIDQIPHPAYMVNYNFEMVWFNQQARDSLLGGFGVLPPNSEGRGLLQLLWRSPGFAARNGELLRFHVALAKARMSRDAFSRLCRDLPAGGAASLESLYDEVDASAKGPILDVPLTVTGADGQLASYRAYASFYREGLLFVYAPAESDADSLLGFLARRDEVIRGLLRKRLPVLTPLAVVVADLQNSVKICSELPPEEYFELINEIWAAMGPIFRKYYGTHGKHVGDGMVYYFFPQPDSHYIFNALACTQELRQEMRKISKAWQLRKNWLNELFLNIGINEGEEWLGTFQSATSIEFAVLGDTINHAGRLSDFARHGKVWATKSLIGKLSAAERARVQYGIAREAEDGREVFVGSSFSLLSGIIDVNEGRFEKFREIAALPVTEIVDVRFQE